MLTPEERMWIQNLQVQLDAHSRDIQQIRDTLQRMHDKEMYEAGAQSRGPHFGSPPDEEGAHDRMTNEGGPAPKDE